MGAGVRSASARSALEYQEMGVFSCIHYNLGWNISALVL